MLGPLFWKELLETARRRRYFLLRVLVVLALYVGFHSVYGAVTRVKTTADLAAYNVYFFSIWHYGALTAIGLLTPALVAGLIAGEKDHRTFEILLTTCLTDREILVGKLASRWLALIMLITVSLPVLAFVSLNGGFYWRDIIGSAAVQLVALLFASSLSIYCSVTSMKPYLAMIKAYLILLGIWLGLPYLNVLLFGQKPVSIGALLEVLSPFHGRPLDNGFSLQSSAMFFYVALNIGASVWLLLRSGKWLRLKLTAGPAPWLVRVITGAYRGLVQGAQGAIENNQHLPAFRTLWRWEEKSRRWFALDARLADRYNPLILRNATANVYDPERFIMLVQMLSWFILFCWVYHLSTAYFHDQSSMELFLLTQASMLIFMTGVMSACAIVRERLQNSWEPLLLTSITPAQYVLGNLWGVLRTLTPTLLLFVLSCGFVCSINEHAWENYICWFLMANSMIVAIAIIGLLFSMTAKRIASAIASAFVVPVLSILIWNLSFDDQIVGIVVTIVLTGICLWGIGQAQGSPLFYLTLLILLMPTSISVLEWSVHWARSDGLHRQDVQNIIMDIGQPIIRHRVSIQPGSRWQLYAKYPKMVGVHYVFTDQLSFALGAFVGSILLIVLAIIRFDWLIGRSPPTVTKRRSENRGPLGDLP